MNALSVGPRFLNDDSTLLNRFALDLSETAESAAVLEKSAAFVRGLLSCDECGIHLLEGDELVLRTFSRCAAPRRITGASRIAREFGWTDAPPEILHASEFGFRDPRYRLLVQRASRDSIHAFAVSPMVSAGRLTGIILAQSYTARSFSKGQLSIVAIATSLVALGIDVRRLKRDNTSLTLRLESCDDIEQAKRILATERQLDVDRAYILMQQESRKRRKPVREIAAAILLKRHIAARASEISDDCTPAANPKSLSQ